jgi:hypothetical protein
MIESSICGMEPLPKRIRRPRGDKLTPQMEDPIHQDPQSSQVNQAKVEANILARSKIIRKDATLETKDGCAGEFYECKHCYESLPLKPCTAQCSPFALFTRS